MKRLTISLGGPSGRTARGTNALVSFGLLVASVVLGGTILQQLSVARIDITSDKLFTLSPASVNLSKQLDSPAVVTLYFTKDLPASMNSLRRSLRDTLEEYRSASGGQLTIREVDPASDPEGKKDVQRLNIPQIQFNTRTNEKISVQSGYLGLGLTYREKNDLVMPVVQDVSSFEYDFSTLLKKALSDTVKQRTVRFLAGHGEMSAESTQALRQQLSLNGIVTDLDLSTEKTVPVETDLVIVAAAAEEIPEDQLKALDDYLMNGGKLFVLSEAITVDRTLQAKPVKTGLETMLSKYGITIGTSIVGDDRSNSMLPFRSGSSQFFASYPYYLLARAENADRSSPIARGLDGIALYWPTAISVKAPEGADGVTIFTTTEEGGFVAAEPADLRPEGLGGTFAASSRGKQPLAVSLSGSFPSAYATDKKSAGGRIVVLGDGDSIRDDVVTQSQGNAAFILNTIDWLAQDEDLIQIRSKSFEGRSLTSLTDAQRVSWKWGNLLAAPILILLGGLTAWMLRRRTSS